MTQIVYTSKLLVGGEIGTQVTLTGWHDHTEEELLYARKMGMRMLLDKARELVDE